MEPPNRGGNNEFFDTPFPSLIQDLKEMDQIFQQFVNGSFDFRPNLMSRVVGTSPDSRDSISFPAVSPRDQVLLNPTISTTSSPLLTETSSYPQKSSFSSSIRYLVDGVSVISSSR